MYAKQCAEQEKQRICNHEKSLWSFGQIQNIVLPELSGLLSHAKQGELYFKYGKKRRVLESTYIITDSIENLAGTELGKRILNLQDLYNSL